VKPLLPRILAVVAGGVMINVAVAVGCALWSSFPPTPPDSVMRAGRWPREVPSRWPQEAILLTTERALGLTSIKSRALVPRTKEPPTVLAGYLELVRTLSLPDAARQQSIIDSGTDLLRSIQVDDDRSLEERASAVLNFVRTNSADFDVEARSRVNQTLIPLTDLYSKHSLHVLEAGWPLRSLEAQARSDVSLEPRGRHAIRLGWWREGAYLPSGRWVPVRPIWPGFIVNSLLYALLLAPCVAAPGLVIARWRCRSGRCPQCGAAMGVDLACDECGGDLSELWRA